MRGPIDYIIVHFSGNKFKGEVLDELAKAMDDGVIDLLDLAVVVKDEEGNVASVELENIDSKVAKSASKAGLVTAEDINEVGDLLENNSSAGLLIIEQLWAKGLKKALINADATLLAEGRIHPEASKEIN